MRIRAFIWILLYGLTADAQKPAGSLGAELKIKRDQLSSLHQEFEVTQTLTTATSSQASKRQIVLDMSRRQWREGSVSGSGGYIRIFDGADLFRMEDGGNEFVRTKRHPKEDDPQPSVYNVSDLELSKAVDRERRPCGLPGNDHVCVVLDVPLKKWIRSVSASQTTRLEDGSAGIVLDTETGLLLSLRKVQVIENQRGGYRSDVTYSLKRLGYGTPVDASLFRLPSGDMHEVKELSRWNAARIKKQSGGKPAPELAVANIRGEPVTLSAFKGKMVLLDFWTTWCPPCRADAPALDKLYRKYGAHDLMIVGISVSEERAIGEKFLKEHPHDFPVVLTTENEMPRPYEIGLFPTYIVIDKDGTVAAAVEGDKGFSDLQKLLKKSGLEIE